MPHVRLIGMIALAAAVLASPARCQSQADMGAKAQRLFEASDSAMNRKWKSTYDAMKKLDSDYQGSGNDFKFADTALDSQRAWLRLRDQQCSIESAIFKGGSMAPMVGAQCQDRMTQERTEDLKALSALTR